MLQGNIETGRSLARDAVSIALADRQFKANAMIQQINDLKEIVNEETRQMLVSEERTYQEEIRTIQRTEKAVDMAMASGAATGNDVRFLTDANTSAEEKLAMSQLIIANASKQERDINLAVKAEQLANLRKPTVITRDTDLIEVNGQKQLIDTQTGEVIASFGADVPNDEIQKAQKTQFATTIDGLSGHPGLSKAVGPSALGRFTPFRADVLTGQVSDFTGSVENVVKTLTLNTYAEAKERGLTFGAMSEGEWRILGESATKLAQWRRERDDGSIYYAISEKAFKQELDTLGQYAKADAIRSGADPAQVNSLQTEDGLYWTINSNGSYSTIPVMPK